MSEILNKIKEYYLNDLGIKRYQGKLKYPGLFAYKIDDDYVELEPGKIYSNM